MESLRICVSLAATCVSLKLCKGGKILRHLVNQRNKIPEICPRHERKKMRKMFSKSRPLFWDYREILSNYFNELMQLLHFVKYKLRFLLRQWFLSAELKTRKLNTGDAKVEKDIRDQPKREISILFEKTEIPWRCSKYNFVNSEIKLVRNISRWSHSRKRIFLVSQDLNSLLPRKKNSVLY